MKQTFNKLFLTSCCLLLVTGIIITQLFKSEMPEIPRVLGATEEVQVAAPAIKQNSLDLFSNTQYLSLQESLFDSKVPFISKQEQIFVAKGLYPPQNVQVWDVKNGNLITITWDEFVSLPQAVKILRSTVAGKEPVELAIVPGADNVYYDADIIVGQDYYYTLISIGNDGALSQKTGPYHIGPVVDATVPNPPQDIEVELVAEGVKISWLDPEDADVAYINIYRSNKAGELGRLIAKAQLGVLEYVDNKIEDGQTYFYFLTSEDKVGNESRFSLLGEAIGNKNPFSRSF